MIAGNDASLLAAAAGGEQAAWDRIVARHERMVWAVIRGYRLSPEAAADAAQVTWLRLVENLDRIRDASRLGPWLATTARHECVRLLRARRHEVLADDDFLDRQPALDLVEPDAALTSADREAGVRHAFERISERCQQLLRLLCTDPPLGYETIAEIIGRPIGSIGPTRARCLDRLRRELIADGFAT